MTLFKIRLEYGSIDYEDTQEGEDEYDALEAAVASLVQMMRDNAMVWPINDPDDDRENETP